MLKLTAIGHLGADCVVRNAGGTNAINFDVAHTEKFRDAQGVQTEKTTWIRCTLWRKPESSGIAAYLKKGQLVYVEGTPHSNAWIDNQSGTAKSSLDLRVDKVELLGGSRQTAQPAAAGGGFPTTAANSMREVAKNSDLKIAQEPWSPDETDLPF